MRGVLALGVHALAAPFLIAGALTCLSVPARADPAGDQVGRPATSMIPSDEAAEVPRPRGDLTRIPRSKACNPGLVWRVAGPSDLVCVQPGARRRVAQENAEGPNHVDPNGIYGPQSCLPGYVWREAFAGDHVCVTPEDRRLADWENISDRAQNPD